MEDSEDETDYSSEDSEAEFVTPQVDAAILKIISRIQSKDSALYDSEGNLFQGKLDKVLDLRFVYVAESRFRWL